MFIYTVEPLIAATYTDKVRWLLLVYYKFVWPLLKGDVCFLVLNKGALVIEIQFKYFQARWCQMSMGRVNFICARILVNM